MGLVIKEMKKKGYKGQVKEFQDDVTSSKSYDEELVKIMNWVHVK
ncbi:hypothetical protein OPHB3_3916 [Oceanobacillus picturae]|uniref:Uncharacterized protein n=1 Tax=Oceanobacillus picturae TaxID=171693 RepID=A0A0U9HBZ2_9BACI|nr:hypothetical protein [Oceanobacillus picturae]GAQ19931.1 hypothetical protein OPHB3_3916 [Oceanobacillus picturae]